VKEILGGYVRAQKNTGEGEIEKIVTIRKLNQLSQTLSKGKIIKGRKPAKKKDGLVWEGHRWFANVFRMKKVGNYQLVETEERCQCISMRLSELIKKNGGFQMVTVGKRMGPVISRIKDVCIQGRRGRGPPGGVLRWGSKNSHEEGGKVLVCLREPFGGGKLLHRKKIIKKVGKGGP